MKSFTFGFLVSSFAYLILAALLGIIFLSGSAFNYGLMVAAVHAFVLGFVTTLIFGVNYHIIPIFSGKHFYSERLAWIHLLISNIGIAGLVFPLPFLPYPIDIHLIVKLSAVMILLSVFVFIYNMMKTFIGPAAAEPVHNPFGNGDKAADKMAVRFTGISIIYLLIGCPLGVFFLFRPDYIPYLMPAHAHINLIGFVSIMIFGVSYHMFPRFAARPLHSISMGRIHFWFVNIGLIGMASSWWFFEKHSPAQKAVLLIFGAIQGMGAILYFYNCWKTLGVRRN